MPRAKPMTTDTFVDAVGRCYIAGEQVSQPVFERHVRQWFDLAAVTARLWHLLGGADTGQVSPPGVIFDPPLTEAQALALDRACLEFFGDGAPSPTVDVPPARAGEVAP